MRERLRAQPSWRIVLAFGVVAATVRLALGEAVDSTAATVLVILLLLALAAVLLDRGGGDGWSIYGVMVLANVGLKALKWPVGVEILLYVGVTTFVTWMLFDLGNDEPERATEFG
jgi:TRAP-type C4-dicarboxylate transport system permease large subunit